MSGALTQRLRKRPRGSQRGFTLPELLIASLAGLIIALTVVALSRDATLTFHDELRVSTAEMTLRLAGERLRSDLQRASYMSTPNILRDPFVTREPGVEPPQIPRNTLPVGAHTMAGLRLINEGSLGANVGALTIPPSGDLTLYSSTMNGLRPDAIVITGNMTTSDEYLGGVVEGGGCGGGGDSIDLAKVEDPAVKRVMDSGLAKAFQPVPNVTFMARVSDPTGKYFDYVPVCGVNQVTGVVQLGAKLIPSTSSGTANAGTAGFGRIIINPIQTVAWFVRRSPNATLDTQGRFANSRFELVRQWVDATGTLVGTPEVVAEYVVDLKFAFTVTQGANMVALPFGDVNNQAWTTDLQNPAQGPHRIQSVRFRLSTRAALPDREQDIPATDGVVYRYCLTQAAGVCTQYARVRPVVSEAALVNQSRMVWQ
jgi:prepilin-type N-terminal cleavage/methylation domain-containing protein